MSGFKIPNLLCMAIGTGQNPFWVAVSKFVQKSVTHDKSIYQCIKALLQIT